MPMPRFAIPAAAALAAAAVSGAAAAQRDARPADGRADSTLATLVTSDGGMRVTLTGRALRVGFTALGRRRIRRAADSAFAAGNAGNAPTPGRARSGWADDAKRETQDEDAKPDKPVPLRDVQQVRASGDSLLLCFASKPGPGPAAPPCSEWRRILITGLPPADAQRFAAAVRRARETQSGVRN